MMPRDRSDEGENETVRERAGERRRSRKSEKIDERLFKEAVKRAMSQPRLAFYSPAASCVLNYWKSAVPRFSISEFLARVIEREIAKAWPKLYERAKKALEKSSRGRR